MSYVLITIIKVTGSAPRHAGAKMLITGEGHVHGTIGGGALEDAVIKDAMEFLRLKNTCCKKYLLGPELGQCCGGEVELFFETIAEPRDVVVFGAGHIAESLCPMLKELGFTVTLIDERAERLNLKAFDIVDKKINDLPSDALREINFNDRLYIIVITHQHKDDEVIVQYCLDKPCKYLGMIGSKKKWEIFKTRFKARGYTEEQISRVVTPIGLDIGAETPFEIAVSIIAELIKKGGA